MARNSVLRRRLQEITDTAARQNMLPDQLERLISELASTHSHSIRRALEDEVIGWNCFEYAFELTESNKYKSIATIDAETRRKIFFAGSVFARFLIEIGALVEIDEFAVRPGDLVIYLDDEGTPTHAGKISCGGKRIKSKWGGGLFLEHELWEVPDSYGNAVRFCKRIPTTAAECAFLQFVKSQDGSEEFVDRFDLKDLF